MSDIRVSLEQMPEPDKSLGKILIEFYETMKDLESDAAPAVKRRQVAHDT